MATHQALPWGRILATCLGFTGLLGMSCGSGSGGDAGTGGTAAPGDTVGFLEVELPTMAGFVLHGTLPLPRGIFPRPDGLTPLAVADADGTLRTTQLEIVSRYPIASDGADVVEVIARVQRPSGLGPGDRATYRVVFAPHPASAIDPGSPGIEDLLAGPEDLEEQLGELLEDPLGIAIEAVDVFGNTYLSLPLSNLGTMRLEKHGRVAAELVVYQDLVATPPVEGPEGTLPHLLGVHAYLSTRSGEAGLGLDLRFHNGHSGNDPTTTLDDPLDTVYFERIDILLPEGWVVVQDFDDPFVDQPEVVGGFARFPLVRPNADGSMHVIEWQGQFHRRLAVVPLSLWWRASSYLRGGGLGFARRGSDPDTGRAVWSWWNLATARWFPQSHPLPSLEHVGHGALRQGLAADLARLRGHLENGSSDGSYPVTDPVLGWAHPFGVPYGGMTGGAEINISDGVKTVEAASREGYQLFRILHRMQTDRMPCALFDADGEPSSVEGWLIGDGESSYVPFSHFLVPTLVGDDPFGVSDAPSFQVDHVRASGLAPAYEPVLVGYDPHDYQHFVRYTRSAKVLAWLANDTLAKDDLAMQAENFHLSYHAHPNAASGYAQASGLLFDLRFVEESPGVGLSVGRGEAWGLDCMNAAYALADPAWRERKRPWFDRVAQLLADGQAQCSGFLQATQSSRLLDGRYRARQIIEQSILENAVLGTLETVYRGEDAARTALLEGVLARSLYAMIGDIAWGPGEGAPWAATAVGPLDPLEGVFCSGAEMPPDAHSPWHDGFQNWSSFAYGFERFGDPIFLDFATLQSGADLLFSLEASGEDNLENRAALLALVQRLHGVL